MTTAAAATPKTKAATVVLPTLAAGQFLMTLKKANVNSSTTEETLGAYKSARIDGLKAALAILGVPVMVALFYAQRIPTRQPGAPEAAT